MQLLSPKTSPNTTAKSQAKKQKVMALGRLGIKKNHCLGNGLNKNWECMQKREMRCKGFNYTCSVIKIHSDFGGRKHQNADGICQCE